MRFSDRFFANSEESQPRLQQYSGGVRRAGVANVAVATATILEMVCFMTHLPRSTWIEPVDPPLASATASRRETGHPS